MNKINNFWKELKKIDFTSKKNLDNFLQEQWKSPVDEFQSNLLWELSKKIYSYYSENVNQNDTVYFFIGTVEKISDVEERKFKEGRRMGQTYYAFKASGEKFQAIQDLLPPEKWAKITNFTFVGQELVFKYNNWIKNKQIIDFYPHENSETKNNDGE